MHGVQHSWEHVGRKKNTRNLNHNDNNVCTLLGRRSTLVPINRIKRVKHRKHEHAHECIEPHFFYFWQFNVYKIYCHGAGCRHCIIFRFSLRTRTSGRKNLGNDGRLARYPIHYTIWFDRVHEWIFKMGWEIRESVFSASRKWKLNTLGRQRIVTVSSKPLLSILCFWAVLNGNESFCVYYRWLITRIYVLLSLTRPQLLNPQDRK